MFTTLTKAIYVRLAHRRHWLLVQFISLYFPTYKRLQLQYVTVSGSTNMKDLMSSTGFIANLQMVKQLGWKG